MSQQITVKISVDTSGIQNAMKQIKKTMGKIQDLMKQIQKNTQKKTGIKGTALKGMKSFINDAISAADQTQQLERKLANLQQAWSDFQAIIGKPLLEVKIGLMIRLTSVILKITSAIEDAGGVAEILQNIWGRWGATIKAVTAGLAVLSVGILAYTIQMKAFIIKKKLAIKKAALFQATMLKLLSAASVVANALLFLTSPIGLVTVLLTVLVAKIVYLWNTNEGFRNFIKNAWSMIRASISSATDAIRSALESMKNAVSRVGEAISMIPAQARAFFDAFSNSYVFVILSGILDNLIGTVKDVGSAFLTMIREGDPAPLLAKFKLFIPKVIGVLLGGLPKLIISGMMLVSHIADGMGITVPELIQKVTDIIIGMIEKFAEALPQFIETGAETLLSIVEGILQSLPSIIEAGTNVIDAYVNTVLSLMPKLMNTGMDVLLALVEGVIITLPALLSVAVTTVTSLISQIAQMLPQIISTGIDVLLALIQGIMSVLPQLLHSAIEIITGLAKTFLSMRQQIICSGIQILQALIQGILKIVPQLLSTGLRLVIDLGRTLVQNAPTILQAGVSLLQALIQGILSMLGSLLITAWNLVVQMGNRIGEFRTQMQERGRELIQRLATGITNQISNAIEAVANIGRRITERIRNFRENFRSAGGDLIRGLWNGINNQVDWIVRQIQGFGRRVTNAIKGIFGINSPSRVMRDEVGKWLPRGIAVGIKAEADYVDNAIEDLVTIPKISAESVFQMERDRDNRLNLQANQTGTNSHVYHNEGLFNGATIIWNNKEDIRKTMQEMAWITATEEARLV